MRAYALRRGLSRYEAYTLIEWLKGDKLMQEEYEHDLANQHAFDYWDVPINLTFPHAYFLTFTKEGTAAAAKLVEERKRVFKNLVVGTFSLAKEAPGIFAGVAAICAMVIAAIGFVAGKNAGKTPIAPATQHAPATTRAE